MDPGRHAAQPHPDSGHKAEESGHGGPVPGGEAQHQLDRAADEDRAADDQEQAGDEARQRRAAAAAAKFAEHAGAGGGAEDEADQFGPQVLHPGIAVQAEGPGAVLDETGDADP